MRSWMTITAQYLYRIRSQILLHLSTCGAILLIFGLYHLPMAPAIYIVIFVTAMALLFCGLGCHIFRRRIQYLTELSAGAIYQLGKMPEPRDALERLYQQIILRTDQRSVRAESDAQEQLNTAQRYYTIWSHQAKTPLAAMRLLIQEGPPDRAAFENELLKAEQYVEMVLQYQRIRSTENDLLLTPVQLDQTIKKVVKGLAPLFISKKLSVEIRNIHATVLSDEKWLAFALEQILTNAAKYTATGGVCIELLPGDGVHLAVTDTGIGIRPEDLPRVTDWGYTGQNGHLGTRSTGIGLALCSDTLKMLGHRMQIESQPGKGTRVILDLTRRDLETF
ncbi:MAG: sensor histidine kinase [Clostridiales bacterium]|nr:sensor histidine kinase [Clostridiales bacterium]